MELEMEHSQATPTEEGIRQDALYVRLDLDRHEEPTGDDLEPLFITRGPAQARYQATAADLRLCNQQGDEVLAKGSIVDSGAA